MCSLIHIKLLKLFLYLKVGTEKTQIAIDLFPYFLLLPLVHIAKFMLDLTDAGDPTTTNQQRPGQDIKRSRKLRWSNVARAEWHSRNNVANVQTYWNRTRQDGINLRGLFKLNHPPAIWRPGTEWSCAHSVLT